MLEEEAREEEEPGQEPMPEPEPESEPMQYDVNAEIETALGLFDPAPAKRSAAVAAEVVTRQQLNPEAEQQPDAPVGGAGKRKSKSSKRHVLLTSSQETVQAAELSRTSASTSMSSASISAASASTSATTTAAPKASSIFKLPTGTLRSTTGLRGGAGNEETLADAADSDAEESGAVETSSVTITTKSESEDEPEAEADNDDDDDVEYTGRTEPISRRWMKQPHAMVKWNLPDLKDFVRGKIVGMRSRPSWILPNLKLGVYELELQSYSQRLSDHLKTIDRKAVR